MAVTCSRRWPTGYCGTKETHRRTHTGGRLVLTPGSFAEESKRARSPFSPYLGDRRKRETERHIPLFHLPLGSNKRLGPQRQESWTCGNRWPRRKAGLKPKESLSIEEEERAKKR